MNRPRKRGRKAGSNSPGVLPEGGGSLRGILSVQGAGRRIRVGQAFEALLKDHEIRGFSPHSIRCTRNLLSAFLRAGKLDAKTPLVEITAGTAEKVLRVFRSGYAPSTAWTYTCRLLQIFRIFVAEGLLLANPMAGLDPPPKPRLLIRPTLTRAEITVLFGAANLQLPSGVRNRAILELFYSTGIRLGECAGLEVGDLDISRSVLQVRRGKGAKDRVVPVGKEALRWVTRYLTAVRPRYARAKLRALWIGQTGRKITDWWIQTTVRRLGRKAGITKPVTPHTLRRTCATHLLAGGASAWAIKELLGHETADSLARYLAVHPRELKNVHEKTHPRP